MDVKTYIDQFNVLGTNHDINCNMVSQMLYAAFLNAFKTVMENEEYLYFKEYQERVFDLVENLRELSIPTIPVVFNYLEKQNQYLVDIIIMSWCLPRSDSYLSKQFYYNKYKSNIQMYNSKLIRNITHSCMKSFCIETLSKSNSIPIHCIDYLWFYMNDVSLELTFYNSESYSYIGFIMPASNDEYINFGFNMEYLLDLGLGQVAYDDYSNSKGSFRNFLKKFVTDFTVVKQLLTTKSAANYKKQLMNISKNPSKYFGDLVNEIPSNIMEILQ